MSRPSKGIFFFRARGAKMGKRAASGRRGKGGRGPFGSHHRRRRREGTGSRKEKGEDNGNHV